MSESRILRNPVPVDPDDWRSAFDDLDLRIESLRESVLDAARAFNLDQELVERIHSRFAAVGEQWQTMLCMYPFAGWPGKEECRVEPEVAYESEASARSSDTSSLASGDSAANAR